MTDVSSAVQQLVQSVAVFIRTTEYVVRNDGRLPVSLMVAIETVVRRDITESSSQDGLSWHAACLTGRARERLPVWEMLLGALRTDPPSEKRLAYTRSHAAAAVEASIEAWPTLHKELTELGARHSASHQSVRWF